MFYLFILKINRSPFETCSIFETCDQKELVYRHSIYMHIERFGMLKVKGMQFRSGVANTRPSYFLYACRTLYN